MTDTDQKLRDSQAELAKLLNGVATPIDFNKKLEVISSPDMTGRFYAMDDDWLNPEPYFAINKANGKVEAKSFTGFAEMNAWLMATGSAVEVSHQAPTPATESRREFFAPVEAIPVTPVIPVIPVTPVTPPAVDAEIPFLTGHAEKITETTVEYIYEDPGPDWLDQLGEQYKITRSEVDDISQAFPQFPASTILAVVKENNQITKRDVESVLAEFSSSLSLGEFEAEALALVVTDVNDKAGMKKAREMRLTAKKERTRFDDEGAQIKEPYLRRGQIVDGIRRDIRNKFKAVEDHLAKQENFEKLEKERIAKIVELTRAADLQENFEWQYPLDMLGKTTLGSMSDAEWLVYRGGIQSTFNERKESERLAEEARIAREEQSTRENVRTKQLVGLGLVFSGERFTLGDIEIALSSIANASQASFDRLVEQVTPKISVILQQEKEKQDLAARTLSRAGRLAGIGMAWNGTEYRYQGYACERHTDKEFIETATDTEFAERLAAWSSTITQDKAERAAEDTRLRESAEKAATEAATEAAELERKRLAPEKEKLRTFASECRQVEFPDVASDIAKGHLEIFRATYHAAIEELIRNAESM